MAVILIVEDDVFIREVAEMMIQDWGHQTLAASDVEAGYYESTAIPVVNISMTNWMVSAGTTVNATVFLPKAPGAAGADGRGASDLWDR